MTVTRTHADFLETLRSFIYINFDIRIPGERYCKAETSDPATTMTPIFSYVRNNKAGEAPFVGLPDANAKSGFWHDT